MWTTSSALQKREEKPRGMPDHDTDTVDYFRYGPDSPEWAPAFWEEYTEPVDPFATFAEAWEDFRNLSYTDLRELADRLENRAHEVRQVRREEAARATSSNGEGSTSYLSAIEDPVVRRLSSVNTYFWNRSKAAKALARYWEEKGPPPKWDELSEEQKSNLPPRRYERRLRACIKVASDDMGITEIAEQASKLLGVSRSTVRKTVKNHIEEQYETKIDYDADVFRDLLLKEASDKRIGSADAETESLEELEPNTSNLAK